MKKLTCLHQETELLLKTISENPRWLNNREFFISSSSPGEQFTNENWYYYCREIAKLEPKALTITSTKLTDVTGIAKIGSLRKVTLGSHRLAKEIAFIQPSEIIKMIDNLLKIPGLKYLELGFFLNGTQTLHENHSVMIRECLRCVQSVKPDAYLDEQKQHYPFCFNLRKSLVA